MILLLRVSYDCRGEGISLESLPEVHGLAKVLVVDDDPQFRRVVRIALNARGHEVREAGNGQEALDNMRTTAADVVLLDWRMPVMDGEQTCRAIRSVSGLPIIVVAASGCETEALTAGANAFFKKPVDAPALLACVDGCTGLTTQATARKAGN